MTSDKNFDRNARLEGEIRAVLSGMLRLDIKDPRLDGVTPSVVRLSADRSHARVFFSVIGDAERERQAADGFAAAASFLRRELGRRMRLRNVPSLEFHRDTSYEYGDRMERLFDRLQADGLIGEGADSDTAGSSDTVDDADGVGRTGGIGRDPTTGEEE
jgi:ribosome-binding factor A